MKHLGIIVIVGLSVVMAFPLNGQAQKKRSSKLQRDTLMVSNQEGTGHLFEIKATPGKGHNYPTFVIWLEKEDNNYIETLYATRYIGKGVFRYGKVEKGKWAPAPVQRKAAVPYWGHKRGIVNESENYLPSVTQPLPDAITGPTPPAAFTLLTRSSEPLNGIIRIRMEVNQTWDWNNYWNNSLYPEDEDYRSSAQPAVVYEAIVDINNLTDAFIPLKPIGRSHHNGATGDLYTDLETLSSALQIFNEISVRVKPPDVR